jgi:cyclic pyranopterin phosphate synthase
LNAERGAPEVNSDEANPPAAGEPGLTHLDEAGNARMVDVGEKAPTQRWARARAVVRVSSHTARIVEAGDTPKGDVLGVARIAGIQAAKRTSDLIPLCHPLTLTFVGVEGTIDAGAGTITLTAEVRTTGPTGVEMEALTAASVAALTVYDMIKGIERGAVIEEVLLLEKAGGRSGEWRR